jgi:hypothetical protein
VYQGLKAKKWNYSMITTESISELAQLIEKAQAFADILQLDFVSLRLSEALDALYRPDNFGSQSAKAN